MKAVLHQEWRQKSGAIFTVSAILLLLNATVLVFQWVTKIDLLERGGGDFAAFLLLQILTVGVLLLNFFVGSSYVLLSDFFSLRRQLAGNTRCLLLTIPRPGAVIFGGKLLFAAGEFVLLALQALVYSFLQVANVISVNSHISVPAVFRFAGIHLLLPNAGMLSAVGLMVLAGFVFMYGGIIIDAVQQVFCRKIVNLLAVDALLVAFFIWIFARQGVDFPMNLLPAAPAFFAFLVHAFTRTGVFYIVTRILTLVVLLSSLPALAVSYFQDWFPWKWEVNVHVPVAAVKESFTDVTAKTVLNILGNGLEDNAWDFPVGVVLMLLVFSGVYFTVSAWYFTRRMEE